MGVKKEARRDAEEFARAQMSYGEGAGTRRKLIQATVDSKMKHDPIYEQQFFQALNQQDMAEHASKARSERRRKDTTRTVSKNVRGVLTGRNQGVNTAVLVLGTAAYYAHQTGLDRKIADATKAKWRKFKHRRMAKKAFHNITTLR